jgi:hypothetical protein
MNAASLTLQRVVAVLACVILELSAANLASMNTSHGTSETVVRCQTVP